MNAELTAAVESGDVERATQIVSTLATNDRINALFHYCQRVEGQPERVDAVRVLLDAGCPPDDDTQTLYHVTPLHVAAWFGSAALVDLLLERGAPCDVRDDENNATPMAWAMGACRRGQRWPSGDYARVITTLLDRGTPWDAGALPIGDEEIDAIFRPLLAERFDGVVTSGDAQALEERLAAGVASDDLNRGLLVAAQFGMTETCRRLLNAGAVVCVPDGSVWTPLHAAAWSSDVATLQVLLENGANVHVTNPRGGTVWHSLGESGATSEAIDIIVAFGGLPDINVPSKYEYTPLDLAVIENHTATIDYMRSLGAVCGRATLPV